MSAGKVHPPPRIWAPRQCTVGPCGTKQTKLTTTAKFGLRRARSGVFHLAHEAHAPYDERTRGGLLDLSFESGTAEGSSPSFPLARGSDF